MLKSKRIWIVFFAAVFILLTVGQAGVHADVLSQEHKNVNDYLNYLSGDEVASIQASINSVTNDYKLDVAIVIADNTEGKSSMDFADDYYDKNGFGAGSDHSGLLMLINMDKREVWISTAGRAIDIFTDSRISNMVDNVTGKLSNRQYFDACQTFISDVEQYAQEGVPVGQHRVDTGKKAGVSYFDKVLILLKSAWVYIIALLVSLIATLIISLSSKGKDTTNSMTYEEDGSFVLSDSGEKFITETTTQTPKSTQSSSGNTSSTHKSSSGDTHGGGGGKF